MTEKLHNAEKTCWNCPAAKLMGNIDFRACGQARDMSAELDEETEILIECRRRPELGFFEPNITFEQCPEWIAKDFGYMLKEMKVMILGIDGYLGWALALKLLKGEETSYLIISIFSFILSIFSIRPLLKSSTITTFFSSPNNFSIR